MSKLRHIPKKEKLRHDILADIRSGALAPGDMLLPIEALSKEYGIAKETARGIVAALVRSGELTARRGKGTFVTDRGERQAERKCEILFRLPTNLNPEWSYGLTELLRGFNDANEDYHVVARQTADHSNLPEIQMFSCTSPRRPTSSYSLDVFEGYTDVLAELHERFRCNPIPEASKGNVTALPFSWNSCYLSINRNANGVPSDIVPHTWSELLSLAATPLPPDIDAATYVLVTQHDMMLRHLPLYWMAGGDPIHTFVSPTSGKFHVNPSAFCEWLTFIKELTGHAKILDQATPTEPILGGRYLFNFFQGAHAESQAAKYSPDYQYSNHPYPVPHPGATPYSFMSYTLLGIVRKELDERQKAGCWAVIRYLLSQQSQERVHRYLSVLPVHRRCWENVGDDAVKRVWRDILEQGIVPPTDTTHTQLRQALGLEVYHFLTEDASVKETLANFERVGRAIVALSGGG